MTRNIDQRISTSRAVLQNPYAHLNGAGGYDALVPSTRITTALIDGAEVRRGRSKGSAFSGRDIEAIARNLQKLMWIRRSELFGTNDVEPLEILDPSLALKALGYDVIMHESLGHHAAGRVSFEVAGIVDKDKNEVQISRRFVPVMRNFTAAHELAHVLLHEGSGLHRDRAPDGSAIRSRDPQEAEADTFASYFLLPEKQVRAAFVKRFLAPRFELTDATAFALTSGGLGQLRLKCRRERDLARLLAAARQYNARHFQSLAERFQVSTEVMAIRLEELGFVRWG